MMFGGIDVGGSKIEACVFDAQLQPMQRQRIATPQGAYAELPLGPASHAIPA